MSIVFSGTKSKDDFITESVLEAEVHVTSIISGDKQKNLSDLAEIEQELYRVNNELDSIVSSADKTDYALAIASGIVTGILDAFLVGESTITEKDIGLSHKQVNQFIEKYAGKRGLQGKDLKGTISKLEDAFPVLQDNVWSGANIGVSAKTHHLADIAHHPTPLGLVAAIAVRFLRVGTFVNKEGELHFIPIETSAKDLVEILAPLSLPVF